jgi:uncharacterized membrane protein
MRIRTAGWYVMTALAIIISVYGAAGALVPALRQPFMQKLFARDPVIVFLHLFCSAIALTIGAFQLNSGLRARYLTAHRWAGRVFVACVIVGGSAGFVMAMQSAAGIVTHIGFAGMAISQVFTTVMAWIAIRKGDRAEHRRWMIRAYAVTYAAVTLRIYLPISLALGLPFAPAYQVISFASWVPNLLIVQWFFLRRPTPAERAMLEMA